MYKVENITNRAIKFQGKIINPYTTETFAQITDIITLSRLTNSNKARYFSVPNKPTVVEKPTIVEDVKKDVGVKDIVEEPVAETSVEDKKEPDVKETEKTVEIFTNEKSSGKRKNKRTTDNE
jgi:hypothetical protein